MRHLIKYVIITVFAIIFVSFLLQDYLLDFEILYYIFVALLIFCTEVFAKWGFNKYVISIFKSKKAPVSRQIIAISNVSISIAAIITGYQIGIEFGINFFEDFQPPLERINNFKIFIAILFFILISVSVHIIGGGCFYVKKEIKKIDKKLIKQAIMKIKLTTPILLVIIAVIILFIPWLFTRESFLPDFSKTGAIGDTIGGLTAPFINALAAILVFIAFREQVSANRFLKDQIELQKSANAILRIQDERNRILTLIAEIKREYGKIDKTIDKIISEIKAKLEIVKQPSSKDIKLDKYHLNKIIYAMSELRLLNELIIQFESEKDFIWKKAYFLYVFLFKDKFRELHKLLSDFKNKKNLPEIQELEPLFEIQHLDETYNNPNKYSPINSTV